jgi:hypothetical protein
MLATCATFEESACFTACAAGAETAWPEAANDERCPPMHNVEVTGAQGQVRPKEADALVRPCWPTCYGAGD